MEVGIGYLSLESEIEMLKRRLDSIIDIKSVNTDKVLELSRELDQLIVNYYNMKGR